MATFDSFFTIGESHIVCEDYAAHTDVVASLSDGCSSQPNTDIGSRILTLKSNLVGAKKVLDWDLFIEDCERTSRSLGARTPCLFATLVRLHENSGKIHYSFSGDGLIASRLKDEPTLWLVQSYDSANNAPDYLAYRLDGRGLRGRTTQKTYVFSTLSKTLVSFEQDSVFEGEVFEGVAANGASDLVVACSDGIFSFSNAFGPVSLTEVLSEFLNFNLTTPAFLKRRAQAFLRSTKKLGWSHHDDFSGIAVAL